MKRWARNYDACIECGTTATTPNRRHTGKGLCGTCRKRAYKKTPAGKAQRKRYHKRWYARPESKYIIKNWGYKYQYGVDLEWKLKELEKQNWKCLLCGKDCGRDLSNWALDHDHETKQVRGILCKSCNMGLGFFKDNISTLQEAQKYLEKFIPSF